MQEKDKLDLITRRIMGAAIEVHKGLGPGLLESAHETCLAFGLRQRGLKRVVNEFPDSAFSTTSAVKNKLQGYQG